MPDFRNPGFKAIGLGFLALILLIPLFHVRGLIEERRERENEARAGIAAQWGGEQLLAPALILVDVPARIDKQANFETPARQEVLLADRAEVAATLDTEVRYRGMFEVPVYSARAVVSARFDATDIAELRSRVGLDKPLLLRLGVSDARGLRGLDKLIVNGREWRAESVGREVFGLANLGVSLPADSDFSNGVELRYELTLAGTRELRVLPFARATQASIQGAWADPSYIGGFLPLKRDWREGGFRGEWQVLDLNRDYPQHFDANGYSADVASSAFGVALYQPANVYQQNERSGKYGILMIALLFIAMFLFEIMRGLRLHPIQYLLVGLALATFYLLLLALSEHLGFAPAYGVAALAATALVAGYMSSVLGSRRHGLTVAAMQGTAYAMFFFLVQREDNALLLGATAVFIALAVVMYLTRRTNWYQLRSTPEPSAA